MMELAAEWEEEEEKVEEEEEEEEEESEQVPNSALTLPDRVYHPCRQQLTIRPRIRLRGCTR